MESLPQILQELFNSVAGSGAIPYLLMIALGSLLIAGFALTFAGAATWVERKVSADIQARVGPTTVGPHRVGPYAFFQWVADGLKFVLKEDIIPEMADRPLFLMAPIVVCSGALATFAVLPFADGLVMSDLKLGLLYIIGVSSLITLGIMMGGWGSGNKWSLLGGMRSAAQIVSYEVPMALSVMSVALVAGTLNVSEVVRAQSPISWFIFHNPFLFLNFFIFFTAGLAETNRTPFDIPEAESELVQGYNTEYSGMRFAVFFAGEYIEIYLMCALAAILFFGGWHLPFVDASGFSPPLKTMVELLTLMTKALLFFLVIVWLRWTLPRYRVDQLMNLCWKYLTPFAFANLLGTAAWVLFFKGKSLMEVLFS
ncbi:MAG: NADH-quinone oxidoreductase subunit NuoH [Deltaproteobacteria bacterium]|nr:NADH-quinone oxidoreductase subunit NuoH [Deltaproteobacteria bacterium]